MNRRSFLQRTATGAISLSARDLLAFENSYTPDDITNYNRISPIVPFKFYSNRKEQMYKQLLDLKNNYGLSRILLVAPSTAIKISGFPSSDVYQKIGETILEVKQKLEPHGMEVGWWCAPSLRSGNSPSFQNITDISGGVADASSCPLDESFRETFSDNVALVVDIARPFIVQFEDDYELSWHPPIVRFGCFCPKHLEAFATREGRYYSREELLTLFSKVTPESIRLRRAWAELSRDTLTDFAALIREKVDAVEPMTRITLCQAGSCDFDGNFTEKVTRAFAGKTRPMVRLYGASYSSDYSLSLPETIYHALYCRQHLPNDFEFLHETDAYPHTRFFISATKMKSLMTAIFSYGFDDSLFYPTQYLDNPLEERGYVEMFSQEKVRLSAIKQLAIESELIGCCTPYQPLNKMATAITNQYGPWTQLNAWVNVLGRFGIPYTSKEKKGDVKMVSGESIPLMTDEQIKELLSGSLFIDGLAAYNLYKRGWAKQLGVAVSVGEKPNFCYEGIRALFKNNNMKGDLTYNLLFEPAGSEGGSFYVLKPLSERTEVLTDFLDAAENPMVPGLIRYENELGGRVVITAFDLKNNQSSAIFNYKKKELVRQQIEWLGEQSLPIFVRDSPNVFCICNQLKSNDQLMVSLFNLSSDPINKLSLDVPSHWSNATLSLLNKSGEWVKQQHQFKGRTITTDLTLDIMSPVVLKIEKH